MTQTRVHMVETSDQLTIYFFKLAFILNKDVIPRTAYVWRQKLVVFLLFRFEILHEQCPLCRCDSLARCRSDPSGVGRACFFILEFGNAQFIFGTRTSFASFSIFIEPLNVYIIWDNVIGIFWFEWSYKINLSLGNCSPKIVDVFFYLIFLLNSSPVL